MTWKKTIKRLPERLNKRQQKHNSSKKKTNNSITWLIGDTFINRENQWTSDFQILHNLSFIVNIEIHTIVLTIIKLSWTTCKLLPSKNSGWWFESWDSNSLEKEMMLVYHTDFTNIGSCVTLYEESGSQIRRDFQKFWVWIFFQKIKKISKISKNQKNVKNFPNSKNFQNSSKIKKLSNF